MTTQQHRYISRLTKDTMALVLAGGRGSRLYELTDWRAKPSVYFGGKFRIIDFPLSNAVNSGIRRVGVLTQYKAHSLIRHIVHGWTDFRSELNEFVDVLPASQRTSKNWYEGTADAIYQNLDIIHEQRPKYVAILSGDHIYKMDYGEMLAYHVEKGSDMTVSCLEVPIAEAAGRVWCYERRRGKPGYWHSKRNLQTQHRCRAILSLRSLLWVIIFLIPNSCLIS